jgi:hypothetical protein
VVTNAALLEIQLDLRLAQQGQGLHFPVLAGVGPRLEEQHPMDRLDEGAFPALVRAADEGPGAVEIHAKFPVDSIVPDGDGEQAHGVG